MANIDNLNEWPSVKIRSSSVLAPIFSSFYRLGSSIAQKGRQRSGVLNRTDNALIGCRVLYKIDLLRILFMLKQVSKSMEAVREALNLPLAGPRIRGLLSGDALTVGFPSWAG